MTLKQKAKREKSSALAKLLNANKKSKDVGDGNDVEVWSRREEKCNVPHTRYSFFPTTNTQYFIYMYIRDYQQSSMSLEKGN